jgi:multidrug efflux pump subunit AcrA (membrane-fusion protein)
MDPFISIKPPTGPSHGVYRLNQPMSRQTTTAPRPINEARASVLRAPATSFEPSKPSLKPVESLKDYDALDDIVAQRKEDVTPEQKRIQALEDSMLMYNGDHQRQFHVSDLRSEKLAEQIQEQAEEAQVQAEQNQAKADQIQQQAERAQEKAELAQAEANNIKAQAEQARAKAEQIKAQAEKAQAQAEKTSSEVTGLRQVLRSDFQTISSKLKTADTTIGMLTARLEAADQEHSWMAAHMRMKTLAEAEGHNLMVRRLRESVLGPDSVAQLQGGTSRLQLTAESSEQQESEVTQSPMRAQEPVEVASPTVRGEEVAEPQVQTKLAEAEHLNSSPEWRPQAITQLTPLTNPVTNDVTFTWEELVRYLGGAQYSPGLYLANSDFEGSILKGKTFWLLEAQFEPFAPTKAGEHGAKLTAFFNDSPTEKGLIPEEEDYANVPVFVCPAEGQGYTYLGTYTQTRYSDKLSHSELYQHVPEHILRYWAELLADSDRPAWVTEQLIAHFWPAPTYAGHIPTDEAVATPATGVSDPQNPEKPLEKRVLRSLEEFAYELRDWKKESQLKAQLLTEEALMEMWAKSDLDEEKGLRPWLEYLEWVGFDEEFYEKLVAAKQGKGKKSVAIKAEPSMAGSATPRANGGNNVEQRRDSAADVPDLKLDESPIKEAKFKRTKRALPDARQGRSTTRR